MTPLAVLPPAGLDSTQVGTMWDVREGSLFLVSTYGAYRTIVELKVSGETAQGRLRNFYDVVDGSPNPGVPVTARRVSCERQGP